MKKVQKEILGSKKLFEAKKEKNEKKIFHV